MKITDIDLDNFDKYEFIQFINAILSYYNCAFGENINLLGEKNERS